MERARNARSIRPLPTRRWGIAFRGREFCLVLRQDERTKNVVMLMLTSVHAVDGATGFLFGCSDRDEDESWLQMDHFLDTPICFDGHVRTVRDVFGVSRLRVLAWV